MMAELLQDLGNNATPLLVLAVLHSALSPETGRGLRVQLLFGLLFGITAMIGMAFPFELSAGLIFDGRTVVLALAGLFGGPVCAAIAALVAAAFRVWIGGPGTAVGVSVIVAATAIGASAYALRRSGRLRLHAGSLLALGLVVHLTAILLMSLLPAGLGAEVMQRLALPYVVLLSLSTLLFGELFHLGASRQAALHALRESEGRFRSLVEGTLVGVYLIQDERLVYASPALDRIFGFAPGGVRGRRALDLVAPEHRERAREQLDRYLSGAEDNGHYLFRCLRADRSVFIAELYGSRTQSDGRPAVIGMLVDVTEREHAARRLADSERLLRESQSAARIGSYDYSFRSGRFETSRAAEEVFGAGEHHSKTMQAWLELIVPEQRSSVRRRLIESLREGTDFEECYQIRRPRDGRVRWIRSLGRTECDETGAPFRQVGIVQDITEQREAELAVQASENKFRTLVDAMPDLVWLRDADGVFQTCNRQLARFFGLAESEIVGQREIRRSGGASMLSPLAPLAADAGVRAYEEWVERADDGTPVLLETLKAPLRDAAGRIVGTLGVARDVTARKRVEEALRRSQELHRHAQRVAQIGHWELDHASRMIEWSDETYRIFGRSRGAFEPTLDAFLAAIHADDRECVLAAFAAAVDSGKDYRVTHRIVLPDGSQRHVEERGRVALGADRHPLRTVGTVQDVSERMRAALELQRELDNTRLMLDTMTDGYVRAGAHGEILDLNQAYCRLLGYSRSELLGRDLGELLADAEADGGAEMIARIQSLPQLRFETRHRRRDGEPVLFEASAVAMPDARPAQFVMFLRDVTAERRIEESYRDLVTRIPVGVFRYRTERNGTGHLEYLSPRLCQLLHVDAEVALRDPAQALVHVHPRDRASLDQLRAVARRQNGVLSWDGRLAFDDELRWIQLEARATAELDGSLIWHGIVTDVTERQRLLERLRLDSAVIASTTESVVVTDLDSRIVSVNRALTDISGYAPEEVIGKHAAMLRSGRHDEAFHQGMWRALAECGRWQGQIWSRRKSGEVFPELLHISIVRNEAGEPTHYVGVASDISQLVRSEERLKHLAHHDALTGLPNRLLLSSRLEHALDRARDEGSELAVLFLDLDRFKTVNDSLGHPVGDQLLIAVAQRMRGLLHESDTLGRLGGDEFLIVLERLAGSDAAAKPAQALLKALEQPFRLDSGHELYVRASIGISVYPADGQRAEILIRNADAAMFRAKEQGRNTLRYYTKALTRRASERLRLETEIRRGIDRGEFMVWYQPIWRFSEQRVVGAEALLRWRRPDGRMVPPDRFIPVAEDSGLIIELGQQVLKRACGDLQNWRAAGLDIETLAINLSPQQLLGEGLEQAIAELMRESGTPPQLLELEITERGLMDLGRHMVRRLEGLKALGVQLAIDDFGTGYSSLSYLKRMPVDKLKIDRGFVAGLPHEASDAGIVRTIAAIALTLQLRVLAEGVETAEQLEFLREAGCHEVQGFLFGPAVPPEIFRTHLRALPHAAAQ